jgi:hypothetical protein
VTAVDEADDAARAPVTVLATDDLVVVDVVGDVAVVDASVAAAGVAGWALSTVMAP